MTILIPDRAPATVRDVSLASADHLNAIMVKKVCLVIFKCKICRETKEINLFNALTVLNSPKSNIIGRQSV